MVSVLNKNIYNTTLISKIKKQTGQKKLKTILENLRNLSKEDIKNYPEFKIKISEEKEGEEIEFIIAAPIIGRQHYTEDCYNLKSNQIVNNGIDCEGKNVPSNVDDIEQANSSDFSEDE